MTKVNFHIEDYKGTKKIKTPYKQKHPNKQIKGGYANLNMYIFHF